VDEHRLWVEFQATFHSGTRQIERVSGTRADLMSELRGHGLHLLREQASVVSAATLTKLFQAALARYKTW
jgi:hypothetical protein